ncbi:hypothetical protein DFZ61_21550 [Escherichia coli]|nr:hypothetical protein [Escherichia coli]
MRSAPGQSFPAVAVMPLAAKVFKKVMVNTGGNKRQVSHKKLRRALKAITRSESYLCAMKAGACRYDTEGYVTEHISQEEETYAAERLDKIRRQNRIKAELQAVLDEK